MLEHLKPFRICLPASAIIAGKSTTPPTRGGVSNHFFNAYLDDKELRRNALFHQRLQALIELAPAGSDERALQKSISNYVAARGKESAERQLGLFNVNSEEV